MRRMEEFLKKIWARLKSWWGAIFTLATGHLGEMVWRKLGDFDLFRSILDWFGVSTDMIFGFLLGPEFALIMATVGVFGMVFLEKPDFKTKHPASQLVGVSLFVIFASLLGGSLVFEQLIQTPKFSEVAQFYIDSQTTRKLAKDAVEKMRTYYLSNPSMVEQIKSYSPISIYSSSDNGSEDYSGKIYDALLKVGISMRYAGQSAQSQGETGIMIQITDPNNPSPGAVYFMSMLKAASIPFKTEVWTDREGWPEFPDFIIFVTRNELAPN